MNFELNNTQREYLGLQIVPENWSRLILKGDSYRADSILYFDGDIIKKQVTSTDLEYQEIHYNELTQDKEFILPKTEKGKPKKLTSATLESRTPIGVYFNFDFNGITIGNHTTQHEYYSTHFENLKYKSINELSSWLSKFINNTSKRDLLELTDFTEKKRKRIKLKEGDFFVFKVDRRNYGFGRIICDIRKLRKDQKFEENKNYGLTQIMTQPLVIKIYHKIQTSKEIDLSLLKKLDNIPSQYIMDNVLFYGDYEVIDNLPLEDWELDFPISYARSISAQDNFKTVYLQYGLIYKETTRERFYKHIEIPNPNSKHDWDKCLKFNPYRNESISSTLLFSKDILQQCISDNSNQAYWNDSFYERKNDLRNPINIKIKEEIFDFFKLDADESYSENLANKNVW